VHAAHPQSSLPRRFRRDRAPRLRTRRRRGAARDHHGRDFTGKWIADQEKRGQTPKQGALNIYVTSCMKVNDAACTSAGFEKMVSYYPNPDAWANLMQAALFSIWHLVWPVKAYMSGDASAATAFAQAGVLLSGSFIAGLVFGYLFWRTGSLYAPMIAHFLNNVLNSLLQIQGTDGTLQPAVALSVVVVIAMVPLALAVGPIARRLGLPGLQLGWGLTVR